MKIARLSAVMFSLLLYAAGTSAMAEVVKLELNVPAESEAIAIRSRDARQQLIVTAVHADGTTADVTRDVAWTISDPAVLVVDSTGMSIPLADGDVTVTATQADKSVVARVVVSGFAHPLPINFRNQVVPIFTKLGCNGGGCHFWALFRKTIMSSSAKNPVDVESSRLYRVRVCWSRKRLAEALTVVASAWKMAATNTI